MNKAAMIPDSSDIRSFRILPVMLTAFALLALTGIAFLYDMRLADWIRSLPEPTKVWFKTFTFLGNSVYYLAPSGLAALVVAILVRWGWMPAHTRVVRVWHRLNVFFFMSIAATGLANNLLKIIFGRARPR
ncbi:MAG: hypothetical protein U9N14_02145, partial [Pseudomonadota bacterium]|nr:hypothetical protein [Pseudomonadota bacterium]